MPELKGHHLLYDNALTVVFHLIVEQIYNLNQMELPGDTEAPVQKYHYCYFSQRNLLLGLLLWQNTINFYVMALFIAAFLHQLEPPVILERKKARWRMNTVKATHYFLQYENTLDSEMYI